MEERIDNEWPLQLGVVKEGDSAIAADIDKHYQYIWGPPATRYIDDLAIRRQDNNKNGDFISVGDKV